MHAQKVCPAVFCVVLLKCVNVNLGFRVRVRASQSVERVLNRLNRLLQGSWLMTGCNMDMYIMNRKTKMLEYVSVSASEGVSARLMD